VTLGFAIVPHMRHPWGKMFDKALRKSTREDNLVLEKAEELCEKGYAATEIHDVLVRLQKSLVDEEEEAIVREAAEEFKEEHLEDDDGEDA
jgi:hypothetical protein